MSILRTYMRWQFLGPHAMAVLGPKSDAICRDHIRLPVIWNTCHGNSGDHMYGNSGDHMYGNSGYHMPWQFWAKHALAVFEPTCDDSCGHYIRMAVLGNTYILNSGDHTRCYCWRIHTLEVLGTIWDISSGDHVVYWC